MKILIKTLSIILLMISTNVSFAAETFLQDRFGLKYKPNESTPYTGKYVVYKKNGLETLFFDRGQLLEETFYKNGLRVQTSTTWHEKDLDAWWFQSGQKSSLSNWAKGKQEGVFQSWYEDGSNREESNWKEGKRHGEGRRWFSNGQLQSITNHKLGVPDGMSVFWNDNGQETANLMYKEGVPVERVERVEQVEASPAEVTPAEVTPAEVTPAEVTPAEGTPAEGTPAEGTPAEGTPTEGAFGKVKGFFSSVGGAISDGVGATVGFSSSIVSFDKEPKSGESKLMYKEGVPVERVEQVEAGPSEGTPAEGAFGEVKGFFSSVGGAISDGVGAIVGFSSSIVSFDKEP